MRFLLTPAGSSGDVHPFLGIGRALVRRGHEVVLITAEPFGEAARGAGLDFRPLFSSREFDEATRDPQLWHPRKGPEKVFRIAVERLRESYQMVLDAWRPGTVLVGHNLSFGTRLVEETRGAPAATVHLSPSLLRSVYDTPVLFPGRDITPWPAFAKRALYWLADRVGIDPHLASALNDFRRELGLPRVSRVLKDWVHSPRRVIGLWPAWFAPPQTDWPEQVRLTGFPLFDEADDHPPDPALEAFLAAGEPPVVVAAGSANRHAGEYFRTAAEALRRCREGAGRRGVLLTRYPEQLDGQLEGLELPESLFHASYVPFSRLLPRSAALVHHGGIGTSAQALAAGTPQLVRPFAFDQPDNAARLERLGVAATVPAKESDPERLAAELDRLLDNPAVPKAAARIAERMGRGDPTAETCELLEELGGALPITMNRKYY